MIALQKAFSRHEKVKRMLTNLDEMREKGDVTEEQYGQMKSQYETILEQALENLKTVRNQIKTEREQVQADLDRLCSEANDIEVRGKVGELKPEQVAKALTALQARKDEAQKNAQRLESWLVARSSKDVGGQIDVDVNQTVDYRSEWRLDWDSLTGVLGGITKRMHGLDGEKIAESVGSVVGQVYKRTGEVKAKAGRNLSVLLIVGAVVVLVLIAGWMMRSRSGASSKLTEKVIVGVIQKQWSKEPLYLDMDVERGFSSEAPLRECASAGLLVAGDPQMRSFRVAAGMEKLIEGSENSFKLHIGEPDSLKVVRFSPPADDGGMKVSYVEYQYNWKPTEILTAGKYQALRDAMRQHLAEVEPKLKIPVVMRAKLGLFTDGWSLVGPG